MEDRPPEPIASDYVELAILSVLFITGGPINLLAYVKIAERPSATRLDILKRHLNYSDLLVLFVYVPSRVCWLITYDWRGGDLLCKIIKFFHTLSFQISSNVIVCIALDRLFSIISLTHRSPKTAQRRTKIMLTFAWITAVIISSPQFAVWKSYLAFEQYNWNQCMQIWELMRVQQSMMNSSDLVVGDRMDEENIYVIVHMMLIFWVPATIVLLCYLIVICWVYLNSRPTTLKDYTHVISQCSNRNIPMISDVAKEQPDLIADSTIRSVCVNLGSNELQTSSTLSKSVGYAPSTKYSAAEYRSKITRRRAIRISFSLVSAYIICWLPYNALSLYQFVDPQGFVEANISKVYCLHSIMVFNSVINPYLYGLFGKLVNRRRRNTHRR